MNLPDPTADAHAHSARLAQYLRAAIEAADNWIPFERYMSLALYAPGLGYYAAGAAKFGAEGDFVTAPEMGALFGGALAVQAGEVMRHSAPHLLEFGAGTGKLAAGLLAALGDACASYSILETSPDLRERQAATLREAAPAALKKVRWLETLPQHFSGCIVANEVLDAMPVHLVHFGQGTIVERGVALDANRAFVFADRPAAGALLAAARALPVAALDGYTTEINLAARAWVAGIAALLARGALLAIDYGFPAAEYYHPQRSRGTLMCHSRHRAHDDPFDLPGLTDITAHVDFSALAASAPGLSVLGYTTQANFLINCGITDLLAQTPATDTARYLPLANQAKRLLSPAEMGELFKVVALGRGIDRELVGFRQGDRRYTL